MHPKVMTVPLNRECPKCGELPARVSYDRVLEAMHMHCNTCGYGWQLKPLDKLREDKERQAYLQSNPEGQAK
jgi:rubredoxin